MNAKKLNTDNVRSISDAIGNLKKKRVKKPKQQRAYAAQEPKEPRLTQVPVVLPEIVGLTEEKSIIGRGIVAINKALFEQSLHETDRLTKIRNILIKLEDKILDEKTILAMTPLEQLRVFEVLRKDCESSVNFLERMQSNSLKVMVIFEIYKKLMDDIDKQPEVETSAKGLPGEVDKKKMAQVRGALIEIVSK
jgi:ribosome biogenesis protein Nip4